ncbi:hypothetical protein CCP2SC5_620016 [Azospirillaceae bacterium]
MFLVVGDCKGGAKAPLIREAIFLWNRLVGTVQSVYSTDSTSPFASRTITHAL